MTPSWSCTQYQNNASWKRVRFSGISPRPPYTTMLCGDWRTDIVAPASKMSIKDSDQKHPISSSVLVCQFRQSLNETGKMFRKQSEFGFVETVSGFLLCCSRSSACPSEDLVNLKSSEFETISPIPFHTNIQSSSRKWGWMKWYFVIIFAILFVCRPCRIPCNER